MADDTLQSRIAEANARLRTKGRCLGHNSGVNIPAVYLWHFPNGNVMPLCAACCAAWKKDVAQDPDPLVDPDQITKLNGKDDG